MPGSALDDIDIASLQADVEVTPEQIAINKATYAQQKYEAHLRSLRLNWARRIGLICNDLRGSVYNMKRITETNQDAEPHNSSKCHNIYCDICKIRNLAIDLEDAAATLKTLYAEE